MQLNPSEISELIKSRIQNLDAAAQMRTQGISLGPRQEHCQNAIAAFGLYAIRIDLDRCEVGRRGRPHVAARQRFAVALDALDDRPWIKCPHGRHDHRDDEEHSGLQAGHCAAGMGWKCGEL